MFGTGELMVPIFKLLSLLSRELPKVSHSSLMVVFTMVLKDKFNEVQYGQRCKANTCIYKQ